MPPQKRFDLTAFSTLPSHRLSYRLPIALSPTRLISSSLSYQVSPNFGKSRLRQRRASSITSKKQVMKRHLVPRPLLRSKRLLKRKRIGRKRMLRGKRPGGCFQKRLMERSQGFPRGISGSGSEEGRVCLLARLCGGLVSVKTGAFTGANVHA